MSTKKEPGYCVECSGIATTEALFKLEGVIMVRKYCNKCAANAEYKPTKY